MGLTKWTDGSNFDGNNHMRPRRANNSISYESREVGRVSLRLPSPNI